MLVVRTTNLDPWRNLAAEEFLLGEVAKHRHILFLWQGRDAVIVGKNQNPWRECRVKMVEEDGGVIARRVSGGGAVFHDVGNLNYAFCLPRREYRPARCFEAVLSALQRFGIAAQVTGRTALTTEGRKFSGNAFCFRRESALHHGTLMVSTDLHRLRSYLETSGNIVHTRAIASRPARVMNLSDLRPDLTIDALGDALADAFAAEFGGDVKNAGDEYLEATAWELREKYASWNWRFGLTPPFDIALAGEFDLGHVRVKLYVEEGIITYTGVSIEGRGEAAADLIEEALRGCPLEEAEIRDSLLGLPPPCDETVARQMAAWIANV